MDVEDEIESILYIGREVSGNSTPKVDNLNQPF